MKKRMLFTITVLLIVASLVGCGGSPTPSNPPQPAQQESAPQTAPTQAEAAPQTAPTQAEAAPQTAPTQAEAAAPAAALDGKALVAERCTKCHGLSKIEAKKASADDWKSTVERMIGKGAQLSDAEKQAVIDYLSKTYAP